MLDDFLIIAIRNVQGSQWFFALICVSVEISSLYSCLPYSSISDQWENGLSDMVIPRKPMK